MMTADEFFDWIERQSEPHELVDGMPVRMMERAIQSHNVATANQRSMRETVRYRTRHVAMNDANASAIFWTSSPELW